MKRKFKLLDYTNDKFYFKGKPFANTKQRFAAYLVDIAVLLVVSAVFQLALYLVIGEYPYRWTGYGVLMNAWIFLSFSIPAWIYFSVSESSKKQASLGKRLLNLKVVGSASGQQLNFRQAIVRTLIKTIPWELLHLTFFIPSMFEWTTLEELRTGFFVVFYLILIYLSLISLTGMKQSLHDLFARTVVLDKKLIMQD